MKQEILDRIQALGGDISQVKGTSLAEDLSAITFNTILYEKPMIMKNGMMISPMRVLQTLQKSQKLQVTRPLIS